ncbi:hypothetical protein BH20ACT9_BH20ACT9_20670 [soil metagenome]
MADALLDSAVEQLCGGERLTGLLLADERLRRVVEVLCVLAQLPELTRTITPAGEAGRS